ncbi:hypothetical protein [Sphingomonas carotinifaciens]|uniref:Uncharacterized protein n=1 Tax=Sphingomonas carotinifaciens TaxID=1166323 RepID=A0A6N8LXQ8_9SPHN|nr:hypothetical protein [Sphingomonas carotinifaciens]MBB4085939.1 hypothetical protein [Sphingomonas carotinifaciens]MWC45327.1 hypothetical protein [Sphingomonas carotinifaciens]
MRQDAEWTAAEEVPPPADIHHLARLMAKAQPAPRGGPFAFICALATAVAAWEREQA